MSAVGWEVWSALDVMSSAKTLVLVMHCGAWQFLFPDPVT